MHESEEICTNRSTWVSDDALEVTPPLFIEVHLISQESERIVMPWCVGGIHFASFNYLISLSLGLFQQCGMFLFFYVASNNYVFKNQRIFTIRLSTKTDIKISQLYYLM